MSRRLPIVWIAVVGCILVAPSGRSAGVPGGCPVTAPPNPAYVPPAPHRPNAPLGMFWYGTDALWILLGVEGRDPGKLFFWSKDYDAWKEPLPEFSITGKRLDGEAPPYLSTYATNAILGRAPFESAILTGLSLPAAGCWELTAHYRGNALTFVMWTKPAVSKPE
jgi:hypothetical protein